MSSPPSPARASGSFSKPSGRGSRRGAARRPWTALARTREGPIQLKKKIRLALEAAIEKKADDPIALNLKGVASFTDSFLICGGNQRRQTQAICDAIVERLGSEGERPGHVEGYSLGEWILIDYSDLVVHVFTRETRAYYSLEKLWGDAPKISLAARERRRDKASSAARKG